MKKELRLEVHEKYDGHCAYCGEKIEYKDMQVDHIEPVRRPTIYREEHKKDPGYIADMARLKKELKQKENLNDLHPACRKCNNYKGPFSIEEFRRELERHSERLEKNAQFMRAVRFGQVQITRRPIIFWFEIVEEGKGKI